MIPPHLVAGCVKRLDIVWEKSVPREIPENPDGLIGHICQGMAKIKDKRPKNIKIPLVDALMSGVAMFSLKDPSLLAFDGRRATPEDLRKVFGIEVIPSDTQMRTILDDVEPEELRPLYKRVFSQLQRGKVLERMTYTGRPLTT